MREDQIQRYGRQILLREVGGAGQRKLLGTRIEVLDQSPAVDVAVAYLVAGGAQVTGASSFSGFLTGTTAEALSPDAPERPFERTFSIGTTAAAQIRLGAGVAWSVEPDCGACWSALELEGTGPAVLIGGAAALVIQRLSLGKSAPSGVLRWNGSDLKPASLPACPHRR